MRTEAEKKLFTTDDLSKMYETGILSPDDRAELVDGEVILLNPGRRHTSCTNRANTFFTEALGRRAIVSVQNPLPLDIYNEPKPDIVILKPREDFYAAEDHGPQDVFLVIEVADTSLSFDRETKLAHYAASGIPEFWVEDTRHGLIHIFRDPKGNTYQTCTSYQRGDSVSPAAFPDVVFKVEDLLG